MALVTRFLRTTDHDDTHIFTFVGTNSVMRDIYKGFIIVKLTVIHLYVIQITIHHNVACLYSIDNLTL
jgi:hypothetical protein